jgi:RNA polymerase sigma-70 factor, ECF subfamily
VSLVFGSTRVLPAQLSDDILAARVAQGDSTALEILYDRHAPTIQGISLKIIGDGAAAEEVLQETFWRVWQSAATYQPQRGSFTGWLFRIARNLAIDTYRRRSVRPQTITRLPDASPILDQVSDPSMDVPEQVQLKLKIQQVRNALRVLPPEQRKVIEMAYFYGLTRQEISQATGEALGTIHTRARLGLKKLREELERIVDFEE